MSTPGEIVFEVGPAWEGRVITCRRTAGGYELTVAIDGRVVRTYRPRTLDEANEAAHAEAADYFFEDEDLWDDVEVTP